MLPNHLNIIGHYLIQSISFGYENVVTKSVGYERVWVRTSLVTRSPVTHMITPEDLIPRVGSLGAIRAPRLTYSRCRFENLGATLL